MTRYSSTDFELKPDRTHDDAGKWFSDRGYHNGNYTTTTRIHTRYMNEIGEDTLKALMAEEGCPVIHPPSEQAYPEGMRWGSARSEFDDLEQFQF